MNHIIKTDKITNENSCLFIKSIIEFKEYNYITVNVKPNSVANFNELKIGSAAHPNFNVSISETNDWHNISKNELDDQSNEYLSGIDDVEYKKRIMGYN